MRHVDDSRNTEPDARRAVSDEFAMRLATLVFEWRATRIASPPPAPSELWMSRSARRTGSS